MQTRKFTRYPTDIPASFVIDNMMGEHQLYLNDASQGGVCFNAQGCIDLGTPMKVSIPFSDGTCNTSGKIAWCYPYGNGQCQLGIVFDKRVTQSVIEHFVLH